MMHKNTSTKPAAFIKISIFAILSISIFAYISSNIPQVSTKPAISIKDWGKLNIAQSIKTGKEIFFGKGGCGVCHSIGPSATARCPDLSNVGENAGKRKSGMNDVEYFVESLYNPKAYVVEGYSGIMPSVFRPPAQLNENEIKTVIAFLQSQRGKPTVTPSTNIDLSKYAGLIAQAQVEVKGNPHNGLDIFFNRMLCVACHRVNNLGGSLGPDLSELGAINTPEYIRESIADPNAVIVKNYKKDIMPKYFKENLTAQEIDDLISYLVTLKQKKEK